MNPDMSRQRAVLFQGPGGNGKSTLLGALGGFIGRQNISTLTLHRLESDRFATSALVGRLANICADLPGADLEGTSMFKAIVGGDRIPAERKYLPAFEFTPHCRLVFSANHLPRSPDASPAFFDRWVVIPCTRQLRGSRGERPQADILAELELPVVLSGLLNLALAALPGLREHGFSESDSTRASRDEFREITDPFSVWLQRSTVTSSDAYVVKEDLLRAYNADARRHGRPVMTGNALGRALHDLRPNAHEGQRTIAGSKRWCWLGIGLLEPSSQESRESRDSSIPLPSVGGNGEGGLKNKDREIPVIPVMPVTSCRACGFDGALDPEGFCSSQCRAAGADAEGERHEYHTN
jgi:putative DNA primase/helicase